MTSVFNPLSASSFAAQPPLMPEPMTIASDIAATSHRRAARVRRDLHRGHPSTRCVLVLELLRCAHFGEVIEREHELLEFLVDGIRRLRSVERGHDLDATSR